MNKATHPRTRALLATIDRDEIAEFVYEQELDTIMGDGAARRQFIEDALQSGYRNPANWTTAELHDYIMELHEGMGDDEAYIEVADLFDVSWR